MNDQRKTKAQLIQELNDLRHRLASVEGIGGPNNKERLLPDLERAEEVLRQYEHIVSSSTDMLALLDTDFIYLTVNEAYVAAFSMDIGEFIGRSVTEIFGEEFFNTVIRPHAERCLAGEEVNYQAWFDFPAHGQKYMNIHYYPHVSAANEVKGFVVSGRNITERMQAEEALAKARDELELRVVERTNELAIVNVTLQDDITKRKQAERELEESHEQLRSLSIHLQSLREESHKLVARELHDELAQSLAALKMGLHQLQDSLRVDQKSLQEEVASLFELAGSMVQRVTELSFQLRPAMLDDLGIVPTLKWEAKEFSNHTGIECNLTVEPEQIDLDPDRATAVYRIFKETLTNIDRHAQATAVKVSLKVESGQLLMDISDNGIGITDEQITSPQSFGLISIRERVLHWGGETIITGAIGEGTTLTVIIPLDDRASHDDLNSNSGGTLSGEDRPPRS